MAEITGSRDCGNSPKNRFVQDVAVAIETGAFLDAGFSGDIVWHCADGRRIAGDKSVRGALKDTASPDSVTVDHAISHGRAGAANGVSILADGRERRFCHVVEFTNSKGNSVAAIKSY